MLDYAQARRTMVDCQLRPFDITDRAVLAVFGDVPRERFVPEDRRSLAYMDQNVGVADRGDPSGRIMLAPMVFARLVQALGIETGDRVLDVGSGRGYGSAILAELGAKVVALESSQDLSRSAAETLASLGLSDIAAVHGPLAAGAPDHGPFDAVVINGAVEAAPDGLLAQLAPDGKLACLQRDGRACRAVVYVRSANAVGSRILFDATAPVLDEFKPAPEFVF